MDYKRIYDSLVAKRKLAPANTSYTERHHILPKSMGGDNSAENIVTLTGREHWVAHQLLFKIHRDSKTSHACHMMAMRCEERGIPQIRNSRMYTAARELCVEGWRKRGKSRTGKRNGSFGTMWISNNAQKKNRKIRVDQEIPKGWVKGRSRWLVKSKSRSNSKSRPRPRRCNACGQCKCERPYTCKVITHGIKSMTIAGFRSEFMGGLSVYSEFDRVAKILINDRESLKLREMVEKYGFNSHQTLSKFLSSISNAL